MYFLAVKLLILSLAASKTPLTFHWITFTTQVIPFTYTCFLFSTTYPPTFLLVESSDTINNLSTLTTLCLILHLWYSAICQESPGRQSSLRSNHLTPLTMWPLSTLSSTCEVVFRHSSTHQEYDHSWGQIIWHHQQHNTYGDIPLPDQQSLTFADKQLEYALKRLITTVLSSPTNNTRNLAYYFYISFVNSVCCYVCH